MIAKELEALDSREPRRLAGYEAERQMAFYLRRAFAESGELRVFHNLRLTRSGEVAQIDHLILHRSGVVIVESKSVTGEVEVNAQGEWVRCWGQRREGMPSPVLQARRQGELLARLFEDHAPDLLDRFAFGLLQKHFGSMARDVLVAVSDQGCIRREGQVPELCKADQVTDRTRDLVQRYRRANSALSLNLKDGGYTFTDAELTRLTAFLQARHTPVRPEATPVPTKEAVPPPATPAAPSCRHCQGGDLEMVYGKYGYYLKCRSCAGNTPARPTCPTCHTSARLRKDGARFFVECPGGHSQLFFQNT